LFFFFQVDYKPRIEAFWNVGGLGLTPQERETRVKKKVPEELLDEPSTKWIQYFGSPVLQLRSSLPLPPLGEMATSQTWECKEFPYDPKVTYALDVKRQHGATVPGETIDQTKPTPMFLTNNLYKKNILHTSLFV
jgi:Mitochondrial 28S ribosomal protein S30 (PDCD9).